MAADNPTTEQPRRKRRWRQFGTRSLFVLTAVVCCLFGVWYWCIVKPYYDQMRTVERIRRGAVEVVAWSNPNGPEQLRPVLGEKYMQGVGMVIMTGKVTETELRELHELPDLWAVRLQSKNVTDEHLRQLRGLPKLISLNLDFTSVNGSGFEQLQDELTRIRDLHLACTPMDDAGMRWLAGASALTHLVLRESQITDAGIAHLASLTGLQRLDMQRNQLTDACIVHLEQMKGLQTLELMQTQITPEGVSRLKHALPNCNIYH